jgi:hypothetical protein
MSAARTTHRLLRLFPPAWRERYGEELADLIVESSGGRVPWRTRLDVIGAAGRERLRGAGLGDVAPHEQARGGALLVLCAWALFVIAGSGVQKLSEHWQNLTPAADRALPRAAFAVLVCGAVCGAVLVLAGLALALPALRQLGGRAIRRATRPALVVTGAALAATAGLMAWAHGLTPPQRDGADTGYAIAFVAWAALCAACLLAWTAAAVTIARRLALRASTLRAETGLAFAVTAAMAVTTAASLTWWAALGDRIASLELGLASALMLAATALAVAGSRRAARAITAVR